MLLSTQAAHAQSADEFLKQASELQGKNGREKEMIGLANKALEIRESDEGYFYRAYAKDELGGYQGAIADFSKSISINTQDADGYVMRGFARYRSGDGQGMCLDLKKASSLGSVWGTEGFIRFCR